MIATKTLPATLSLSNGGTLEMELPSGENSCGCVLVVHEWWGVNDDIRRIARRLVREGFAVVLMDLYHGLSTEDPAEAIKLSNEFKTTDAMNQIRDAARAWKSNPRSNGRVGVTGFCLGGGMSLAAACQVEELVAAVPFYGSPRDEFVAWDRTRTVIQGHFAQQDSFVNLERVQRLQRDAVAAGRTFELFTYEAHHAFMREADASVFHPECAALAWSRAVSFLHASLDG